MLSAPLEPTISRGRCEVSASLTEIAELLRAASETRERVLVVDGPTPASYAQTEIESAEQVLGTAKPVHRVFYTADIWTFVAGDQLSGMGCWTPRCLAL